MRVPEHDDANAGGDGCPVPEPKCPKCGADSWRYVAIPGQGERREGLAKLSDRMMFASFGLGAAAIGCLFLPELRFAAFLCGGALAILLPSIRALRRHAYSMPTTVSQCESCGFSVAE